jgi:hypothetical protein
MNSHRLNPFRYGNPVPPEHFVGREDVVRTLFSRIHNGESTAIVGQPHSGKSSILRYIADEGVYSRWLGEPRYAFVEINCHLLSESYQPADFWKQVLNRAAGANPDPGVQTQLHVVERNDFGSFTLKGLFEVLGRVGIRVVLLIDEFDVLLHHPNFNKAEFFGALRALAIQTDGLAIVTSSRLSVSEMNRRSLAINPLGSPFFNNLIEVRLSSLRPSEIDQLIDQALANAGVRFTAKERAYIARISGRHPFLVQVACAALFEAVAQGLSSSKRYTEVDRVVQDRAADHFGDVWRHLENDVRRVMLLLALAELPAKANTSDLGTLDQFETLVSHLSSGGLVEALQERQAAGVGARWRIGAAGFARWMIDHRKWEDFAPSSAEIPMGIEERLARIDSLRAQIAIKGRRLRILEEQAAAYGLGAPPVIKMQIEDTQREIQHDEGEIQRLGSAGG